MARLTTQQLSLLGLGMQLVLTTILRRWASPMISRKAIIRLTPISTRGPIHHQRRGYSQEKNTSAAQRNQPRVSPSSRLHEQSSKKVPSTPKTTSSPAISLPFGIATMVAGLLGWIYYPRIAEYEEKKRQERRRELEASHETPLAQES